MHLDHKIPWNTASSHFTLVQSNPHYTPRRTGLFPRNLASQPNDLNHFVRVLVNTIREFSTTERAKYPVDVYATPLREPGKLFSDELLAYPERKYGLGQYERNSALHNPLSAQHQRIEYWVSRAEVYHPACYTTSDGDLADAVKMLIIIAASASENRRSEDATRLEQEAMSALMRLSQHPKVPLQHLHYLSWGHSFGVLHVADTALQAYLLINIMDAVLARQRYAKATGTSNAKEVSLLELDSFRRFAQNALADYDYPAQNIPHRAFWNAHGVNQDWGWARVEQFHEPASVSNLAQDQGVRDPLAGGEGVTAQMRRGLQEYLKMCFAIMYRYDLLLRMWLEEKSVDEEWKRNIGLVTRQFLGAKVDMCCYEFT